jgi:diacylglycerol kinase (ATP)
MRIRIIANPVSGGGRGKRKAQELAQHLEAHGLQAEVSFTQQAGDAQAFAGQSGADCVVAVGGDGTVNEIVNGMTKTDATLAILPMGTANVVARELGLPSSPKKTAQVIRDGRTRTMDALVHDNRRLMLGAGAGLDAAVSARVHANRGTKSSYLKWIVPSVQTVFTYSFPKIKVTVDGKILSEDAQYAVVGNCRYSAGVFPITPKAKTDDGLLDVCLLHRLNPLKLGLLAAAVWSPGFISRKDVRYAQGEHVVLEPAENDEVPLQIDGDPAGCIPATFTVEASAVRFIVPSVR